MRGNYLIPANSKKSELILGIFTMPDLILFLSGIGLTLLLLMTIHANDIITSSLLLIPAVVASFLVFPIPNYHNILQVIINIFTFLFISQNTYKWKGWCYRNGRK